jgi:VanZ family protein
MRVFLKYWLPVLIWMTVIFGASADSHSYQHSSSIIMPILRWFFPQMPDSERDAIHHLLRKCCHLAEYAVLGLLVFRALNHSQNALPPWSWPRVLGTLLIIFLYASSDEFHQSFVPTRTSRFSDVLIDTAGGCVGLLITWGYWRIRKTKA